jgi:ankyrin repeat protein
LQALLDAGADSSIPDVERMTPLHRAAIFGHAEIVRLLLTKGKALANVLDSRDWSPLYVAAESGSLETVQILLDHGARIDITNSEGRTPLLHAISCGHIEIAQLLIDRVRKLNNFLYPRHFADHLICFWISFENINQNLGRGY